MIVMSLIGSLGLFLYGLKTMSEGMQQAAGEKMRSILEVFTKNKLISVLVGTFFTALIQSADGTAVLTMSFVNSGLLELSQSAGLLLGANLGSGVTGQMLSFDPEYLAPVLILGGVILTIAGRKKKTVVNIGQVFLGFGFLFIGISGFSKGLALAGKTSFVQSMVQTVAHPLLALVGGFLVGMIFQSELAVMGLIAVLTGGEWLSLTCGLFMLLGANMGCTLSVMLIGLGCKKEGKRVAGLQILMNLAGGIFWVLLLLFWGKELEGFFLKISSGQGDLAVVNANMIMKLVWVIGLLPCTRFLIRETKKLIPGQDGTEDIFELKYIGENHGFSPATAVLQAIRETEEMGKLTEENLRRSMETIQEPTPEKIQKVYQTEKNINFLHREITSYLVQLKQSTLAIDDAVYVDSLLYMVTDLERIADRGERITNSAIKLKEGGVHLTREGEEDLRELAGKVEQVLKEALEVFYGNEREKLSEILAMKEEISQSEHELQAKYIERIAQDECSLEAGMIFADIISDLERVAVHGVNIACGAQEDI